MIALVLVLVGFLITFGQKDFAKSLVAPLFGTVLVLSFLPDVVESCAPAVRTAPGASSGGSWAQVLLVLVLAVIGFFAWRGRADAAKRRAEDERRNGKPRDRVLPAPPSETIA